MIQTKLSHYLNLINLNQKSLVVLIIYILFLIPNIIDFFYLCYLMIFCYLFSRFFLSLLFDYILLLVRFFCPCCGGRVFNPPVWLCFIPFQNVFTSLTLF